MSYLTLFQLIFGSFKGDHILGSDGKDIAFGLFGDDKISGGAEADSLFGGYGADVVIGNTGNDQMFGSAGDDLLVWNNGDGSDLMNGGDGTDRQQVNFDTDLVNTDLQNDDVAAFTTTENGIQFARIEVNGQTERGLFQLDIRETEVQETNFGGGKDTAIIGDGVLDAIQLQLYGGAGIDTLDFSGITSNVSVNLDSGAFVDNVFFANGVIAPEDFEGLDLGPAVETSKAIGFENVIGTEGGDQIIGNDADNVISGGSGDDRILGGDGDDTLIGNKGGDTVHGDAGDDTIIWNNGDGSDLFDGGADEDRVQVNFDTDLVNTDLQNKDVATFATTAEGVQFARIEVNDQSVNGLFQLDIRNTETLETNFGGGDDTAVLEGDVVNAITLDLDGGAGVDTLDLGAASGPVSVDLATGVIEIDNGPGPDGRAINFENVTGTASNDVLTGNDADNVIRGGSGDDTMSGGEGADTFVFFQEDAGVDVILDFEVGIDQLAFFTNDPDVTEANLLDSLSQTGDDVELALNNKLITFEDVEVADFTADMFLIA
ncbi:calcium-binding protein [Dinoroseobacter sp. S375]|uniref:calcium-binding protein n=1 Tax=Dinoroseobacter sp. S375 TaxID=3415136 RepID=UPI003C7A350A